MKRLLSIGLTTLLMGSSVLPAAAQSFIPERDSSDISIFERVTKLPKRTKAFNLNLEMQATFNANFFNKKLDEAAFRFNQVKLEANGEVNDRLFYWYRQNLNQGNEALSLENLPESIEYALIGYRLTDKLTITAGKQDVAWGGFEYDLNPLDIYEYSDMNEYLNCYFTGVTLGYELTPSQELRIQVTDNRLGSLEEAYGTLPEGTRKPTAPLFYTLNWNSSYLDETLNLRYSITASEQAKNKWMYMAWAGHQIEVGLFNAYFDVMYTRGALDPLGILSEGYTPEEKGEDDAEATSYPCALNADYLSLVAEANYRFHPKWNLFTKGMYETASIYKSTEQWVSGKYRTAWGYQAGVEFYPMADENLHIFLMGAGRTYNLTEKAKSIGASIDNTARLTVGFIYSLPLY